MAAPPPLLQSQSDPDLEESIDEYLLVLPEVNGSEANPVGDGFSETAVRLGSGKEHVRRPVRELRIDQVLASERIEGSHISNVGR
jgi:hypothetical protein